MTTEEKLVLIREVGEEVVTEEDLKKLLETRENLITYDGFEPSGQMHIAQGILRTININKMIKAGFRFKMWVADWHAYLNNKLGGDMEKIKITGKYFIEVWKAAGMDLDHVEFLWASDVVKDPKYWELVMKVAKTNGIRRFIRASEIMGREESMDLTLAQLMYVAMQTADIFYLNARVTQLGMDQRKVNVLAREIGPQLGPPAGGWKPVVVSHHMLMGLSKPIETGVPSGGGPNEGATPINVGGALVGTSEGQVPSSGSDKLTRTIALKMSKSNPDSAIFMTDTTEDITRKINKAYCLEGVIEENPILEYCRYILFEKFDSITIERPEKYGGTITVDSYDELEKKYVNKEVHPQDLKQTVSHLLDQLLQPVREHFEKDAQAKALLQQVQSFQVTR